MPIFDYATVDAPQFSVQRVSHLSGWIGLSREEQG